MRTKPILFSTDMVIALLSGQKKQTRRIVKSPFKEWITDENVRTKWGEGLKEQCKFGKIGDILWVRESFQKRSEGSIASGFEPFYYKAGLEGCTDAGWKPSIHMPKSACRLFLQITDIRVERLQDISEEDAKSEGIKREINEDGKPIYYFYPCLDLRDDSYLDYPKTSFYSLWKSINGKESWENNPWVWVIQFEMCEMPTDFLTPKN